MKQEFYSNLNKVDVIFKDKKYNYSTDISGDVTEVEAKEYFINKFFNVGIYPKDNLQKCISIKFYENPKNKGLKGVAKKTTKKVTKKTNTPIKYLGEIIKKEKSIRTNKTIYCVSSISNPALSLIDAKMKVIGKHVAGKVSVLDVAKIKKMVAKIKTKTDLNLIIKQVNSERKQGLKANLSIRAIAKSVSVTGLKKADGTLKKGYKYQKQANGKTKIVKAVKKPIAKKKVIKKKAIKSK